MKTFNLAIVGLGNIGTEVYKSLNKNKDIIKKKTGFKLNIIKVSAKNYKKKRSIKLSKNKWEKNPLSLTKNKNIDIIIELVGGNKGIAKKLVFESLKNKKHVVTANKSLIAKYGDQLSILAEKNAVNLLFEASVGGGIPIIRSIKQGLIANKIFHVYGILNGTTNYILSEMENKNISFKEALIKAQKLGYAERNPISDVKGIDAAEKISILSSICFGCKILNKGFIVEGITNVTIDDINFAKELGLKIKLLAISEKIGNYIKQRVHPCLIPSSLDIANINGVTNAIVVDGTPIGRTIYEGEGAGKGPTTSAIISDISSIMVGNDDFSFGHSPKTKKNFKKYNFNNHECKYYIRILVSDKKGVLSKIATIFARNNISVRNLVQKPKNNLSNIVLITHYAKEINVMKAMRSFIKNKSIFKKTVLIRIRDQNKL
tara:strand:- start:234 stop:1526 length:1293 start_codon:yes stop_codon:yes gene_type:complete